MSSFSRIQRSVDEAVLATLKGELAGQTYTASAVEELTRELSKACLKALHALELPFKFIVSVNLGKPDTTFHTCSACLWNQAEDGSTTVQWRNELDLCSIVNVFCVAL